MAEQQDHPSSSAVAYATALLDLANEKKITEQIAGELKSLQQIIAENPAFKTYLGDPSIGDDERQQMLERIFGGKVSPLLDHFLHVVAGKERLGMLEEIADAFDDLLDEQLGKIEVDVTVAQKLSADQLEDVRKKVSAALKKDAVVHQYVDESIIGGLVIRFQDRLIDASVKTQLESLRQQMLSARK
jgi:F-type H+-transporting ATPase subunit delta